MHSLLFLILFFHLVPSNSALNEDCFSFFGFNNSNLILDGVTTVTSNGLLDLTNNSKHAKGHAFYPFPLKFKSQPNKFLSFSTTFVFAILSGYQEISGHGLAFVLSPTTDFSSSLAAQYLGLSNPQNNGKKDSSFLATELDTVLTAEFQDYDDDHVGIDSNSLISDRTEKAGFYDDSTSSFKELNLKSGLPIQVWVDFDCQAMELNVAISSMLDHKPTKPLISSIVDL